MAVTPTGAPIWGKATTFEDFGGHADKKNYQSQGAVNPLTDLTAEQFSRMASDAAAMARVADFAVMNITFSTGTNAPTVNTCRLNTAETTVAYTGDSPPSGFPTATGLANGHVRVTFATSYTDDYGVSQALVIKNAEVTVAGSTAAFGGWDQFSDNAIDVYVYDDAGALTPSLTITLVVSA